MDKNWVADFAINFLRKLSIKKGYQNVYYVMLNFVILNVTCELPRAE